MNVCRPFLYSPRSGYPCPFLVSCNFLGSVVLMSMLALIGMNISTGIVLASLCTENDNSFSTAIATPSIPHCLLPSLAILLGTVLAGFPGKNASWSSWSRVLYSIGAHIFPTASEKDRYFSTIGSSLILLGALYSSHAKTALSHPWLVWMGKVSFAVFLIHTAFLRTVLAWMIFGGREIPVMADDDGNQWRPRRTGLGMALSLGFFFPIMYLGAWAWWRWVESKCGKLVGWVEAWMVED